MRLYQIHEFGDSGKINGNEGREIIYMLLFYALNAVISTKWSELLLRMTEIESKRKTL